MAHNFTAKKAEADRMAAKMIAAAGYDPGAGVTLLKRFKGLRRLLSGARIARLQGE